MIDLPASRTAFATGETTHLISRGDDLAKGFQRDVPFATKLDQVMGMGVGNHSADGDVRNLSQQIPTLGGRRGHRRSNSRTHQPNRFLQPQEGCQINHNVNVGLPSLGCGSLISPVSPVIGALLRKIPAGSVFAGSPIAGGPAPWLTSGLTFTLVKNDNVVIARRRGSPLVLVLADSINFFKFSLDRRSRARNGRRSCNFHAYFV